MAELKLVNSVVKGAEWRDINPEEYEMPKLVA